MYPFKGRNRGIYKNRCFNQKMIDVHCHLDLLGDVEKIVERARKAGVNKIVCAGVDIKTNRFALKQSRRYKEVECVLGLYPDEALKMSDKEIDNEINYIREQRSRIAGIGEVGMDFKHTLNKKDRERQEKIFRKFISLAVELNKPIIVHSRDAENKCIDILEEMKARKVIMHCFSGSLEQVKRILEDKWYLSIPTCICYNKHFEEVVKTANIDRLFCETDSPFMHPEGSRDENGKFKKNEPANVVASYEKISEIKGIKLREVEKKVEENYKRLFD